MCLKSLLSHCILFSGTQAAAVEAGVEPQQYELIACLERSFRELLASSFALCSRFDRFEQLVLQHRSAFDHQKVEWQLQNSSAVAGNSAGRCVSSGLCPRMCTSEMQPETCHTRWTDEEQLEVRGKQTEKDMHCADVGAISDSGDPWTNDVDNSQPDYCCSDAYQPNTGAWPDVARVRTSADAQCKYSFSIRWFTFGLY